MCGDNAMSTGNVWSRKKTSQIFKKVLSKIEFVPSGESFNVGIMGKSKERLLN